MKYNEVNGNLITLGLSGAFDVIAHGCNCKSVMGAGIAPQMANAFGADKFEVELWGETIEKLGNIDFQIFVLGENAIWNLDDCDNKGKEPELIVVNAYTQDGFGSNHKDGSKAPLDYEALTLCMRKMNKVFKGKHIGLPKIGCGLAGGIWDVNELDMDNTDFDFNNTCFRDVKTIIQEELKDCDVTIVIYE